MASLKDVARVANVSLMTVSRVLNDPKRVKPETLSGVQEAILQLNYVPDLSARQVRRVGSVNKTIGVLALDTVTTPFSVEITLSIEETARAYGWNSFVVNMFTDDNPDDIVDLLLAHRPGDHFHHHGTARGEHLAQITGAPLRAGQLREHGRTGCQLYS